MEDKIFDKFRSRLVKEGLLKSLVWALIAGFAALLISSAVCWFTGFKAVWIVAIIFVAVTGIAFPVLYFTLFRPTEKQLAKRMDELGLEERVITMKELEGNNSFMAQRQRADAMCAIGKVNAKLIKIAIAIPLCIVLGVVATLGSGMTVVSALAANDIIKTGSQLIEEANKDPVPTYTITYEVEGEGFIEGDILQLIDKGEDGAEVVAVPDDGFVFIGWEGFYVDVNHVLTPMFEIEGADNPVRQELSVDRDMTFIAIFEEAEDGGDGEGGEGGEGQDGEGEADSDPNGPMNESQGGSESSDPSEGNGGDTGAPGKEFGPENNVIDGDTHYGGDTFDNAYGDAMGSVGGNDPDRGTIGGYFDAIH